MGVVSVKRIDLNPGSWASLKPSDYKGGDLDKALAALQAAQGKEADVDPNSVASLQQRIAYIKEMQAALNGVKAAAAKTAADLKKNAKDDKKGDYQGAASCAETIGKQATSAATAFK